MGGGDVSMVRVVKVLWLCCNGNVGGKNVFLLLVGVGPGVNRVRVRFRIVLRLPARKNLDMGGMEAVWYASDVLVWIPLVAGCVGGFKSVL